ncbi:HlyD family secretion protein [Bizionia sediminis]|uniref:HlyD family secretion protein n=1 Tax=Bizionia sediminis TaxID=1737064 RepID=A0ABW5KSG7_9FLAO
MKTNTYLLGLSVMLTSLISCSNGSEKADGYGNFEATEVIISAENSGKLMQFLVEEGVTLQAANFVGYIDTLPLHLKRTQLQINKDIITSKSAGVLSEIHVLKAQLETATKNKTRIKNLLKDQAATPQQLDNILGEIAVINSQIRRVEIQNAPVVNELKLIDIQIEQIKDQIKKSTLINPVKGTVLTSFMEANEIATFGKPLYKIANLDTMELRVFVSQTQLANITLGETVTVKIDKNDGLKSYKGTVIWIANEAEFTPKIIQTKQERVALVYAVKIAVKNDGDLKIGMPAEMWLNTELIN